MGGKKYYSSYSEDDSQDEIKWKIRKLEKKLKKKKYRKRRHSTDFSRSSSEERSSRYSHSSHHHKRAKRSRDHAETPCDTSRRSRPRERSEKSPRAEERARERSYSHEKSRRNYSSRHGSVSSDSLESRKGRRSASRERSNSRSREKEDSQQNDVTPKESAQPDEQKKQAEQVPADGVTSTPEGKAELNKELDADVLEVIGKRLKPDKVRPSSQHPDIEIRWKEIYNSGLPKEERNSYFDKYAHAENCKFVEAPKLNPEVKASLQPLHHSVVDRDNRLILKQEKVSVCLAALGSLLSVLLNKEEVDRLKFINVLSDSCRILVDLQRDESLTRKSLILAKINATVREALKETTMDEWLFGSNLDEKLKAARLLERSKKDLKISNKTAPKLRSKNSRGPPHQSNSNVSRDNQQTRSGSGRFYKTRHSTHQSSQYQNQRGRKPRSRQESPPAKNN